MNSHEIMELRTEIALQILDTPTPDDVTWEQKIGFQIAKVLFAKLAREGE
jgi:hypothetical protein